MYNKNNTKVAPCITNLMICLQCVHQSIIIQLVQFQKMIYIQNSTEQRFPKQHVSRGTHWINLNSDIKKSRSLKFILKEIETALLLNTI